MSDSHFVPVVGKTVKLGKAPKREDSRTRQFTKYKTESLPTPPATLELTEHVAAFPMFKNDSYGDCTCATAGHMEQIWTSFGTAYVPTDDEVLDFYWNTTSPPSEPCPPGGASDTGRVEIDVLNYWKNHGFGTTQRKIQAYTEVNPKDTIEVKQAAWLFGGLYIGVALPGTAQGQSVWDVVKDAGEKGEPGSWGGHAVNVAAYDADTLTVITWGQRLKMTWSFWTKYVDEAYALLAPEWAPESSPSPTGFAHDQLQTDLGSL